MNMTTQKRIYEMVDDSLEDKFVGLIDAILQVHT